MYSTLKTNFYVFCLNSVFLNMSTASSASSTNFSKSMYHRSRNTFINRINTCRQSLCTHLTTSLFVKHYSVYASSVLRNLNFLRLVPSFYNKHTSTSFSLTTHSKSSKRKTVFSSVNAIKSSISFYFLYKLFGKFNSVSTKNVYGRSCLYTMASLLFTSLLRRPHSFFFKKLIRLFIFHSFVTLACSRPTMINLNSIFSYIFLNLANSCVSSYLFSRLYSAVIRAITVFIGLLRSKRSVLLSISAIKSNLYKCLSTFIGSLVTSSVKFISFSGGLISFFNSFFLNIYRFLVMDTSSLLNNTFNFFINNASARNVFSSLNLKDKMLYGTTSGSFKLKKRVRFKKHAMFMVAAKFNRNIAHYYKSKSVRALYIHFTGFRRSFSMVFQFFRNLIRRNAKYHFKPLHILFKSQPASLHKLVSHSVSPYLARILPLHMRSITRRMSRSAFPFLSNFKYGSVVGDSNLFFSTLINSYKLQTSVPLYSASTRQYSTYLPFSLRSHFSLKNSTTSSGVLLPTPKAHFIFKSFYLSPWLYSIVSFSIVRTRRQYKLYKKLITPLYNLIRLDQSEFTTLLKNPTRVMCSSLVQVRSHALSFSDTVRRSSTESFNVLRRYRSFMNPSVRTYSTSVAKDTISKRGRASKTATFQKKNEISIKKQRRTLFSKKKSLAEISNFRSKMKVLSPTSYLSVFRTRMAIFLNTIFSGSSVRYRSAISHGGCYKRKRNSDRRYWF